MTIQKLGWVVAAALAGSMVGMGFHAPGEKTGNVDIGKIFNECDLVKKQTEALKNQFGVRQSLVDFLKANPFLSTEKMTRFRDLSVKTTVLSAAEKTELEAIKAEDLDNANKLRTLSQKEKPTAAEIATIEELNKRKDAALTVLERWVQEFSDDMQSKQGSSRTDILQKIQDGITKTAKEQGYSVVFSREAAPFSANDITPEVLKTVNKMN